MKHLHLILAAATTLVAACQSPAPTPLKPRIVVLTDIGPADVEPDDNESAVRLLAYADRGLSELALFMILLGPL